MSDHSLQPKVGSQAQSIFEVVSEALVALGLECEGTIMDKTIRVAEELNMDVDFE